MAYKSYIPDFTGMVITQSMALPQQFASGVRALDIRARHVGDRFVMHHGDWYLGENFDRVLQDAKRFLGRHPTEAIVMKLQQSHPAANDVTRTFAETLAWYRQLPEYAGLIYTHGCDLPTLGGARGKIVILDDFEGSCFGPDYDLANVQDRYEFSVFSGFDRDDKQDAIQAHFDSAVQGDQQRLYVNFTSGYGSDEDDLVWTPWEFANYINPREEEYLRNLNKGRVGVVFSDFPSQGLLGEVIDQNVFY